MELKEFSGKTVEEALAKAEAYFGLSREDLKVKVVADETSGQYKIGLEQRALIVARPTPEAEGRARIAPPPPAPAYERSERPDRRDRRGPPSRGREDRRPPPEAPGESLYAPQPTSEETGAAERGPSSEASQRARSILEGLLAHLPLSGQVEVQDAELPEAIELAVSSDGEHFLLGEGGEVLAALTYLVNRMVNKGVRETKRIAIEADGYRSDQAATLERMARDLAAQVRSTGEPARLEPMNSYDRRIVHLSLKNTPGIITESEGEGPYKRLVIRPATGD